MGAEKQLFVLRHAKSSWDDPGLEDHERPLAPRGLKAVKLLDEHMRAMGIRPAQVLCSSARRTRETLDGLSTDGEVVIEPGLYAASCAGVIEQLRAVPEATRSVMVVGHNPAMQMLVLHLAGASGLELQPGMNGADDSDLAEVRNKFPTGALATLEFDCAWSELAEGCAALVSYVRPRTLGA